MSQDLIRASERSGLQTLIATTESVSWCVRMRSTTIVRQQKQIEALTAGLQKVSAQLEASKPAAQMALNNP